MNTQKEFLRILRQGQPVSAQQIKLQLNCDQRDFLETAWKLVKLGKAKFTEEFPMRIIKIPKPRT